MTQQVFVTIGLPGKFTDFLEGTSEISGDNGKTPLYVAYKEHSRFIRRGRGHTVEISFKFADVEAVREALTVLREQGPAALMRRIRDKLRGRGYEPPARRRTWTMEPAIAPLAFRESSSPSMSIVIPAYGQALATYTCLKSVHDTVRHEDVEVIGRLKRAGLSVILSESDLAHSSDMLDTVHLIDRGAVTRGRLEQVE